jgi:undecaprenyl-diphosphatase
MAAVDVYAKDLGTLFWFERLHRPWLDGFMLDVTHLGDTQTVLLASLIAATLLAAARRVATAAIVVGALLLGLAISESVKPVVNRTRPDVAWRLAELPRSPSFPSGHSLCSMALYGGLGLVLSRRASPRALRILLVVVGIGLSILIGTSRSYLGVHYPLDVLGGWTAGLACALLAYWLDGLWGERTKTLPAAPAETAAAAGSRTPEGEGSPDWRIRGV